LIVEVTNLVMASDTPERFLFAASARCTRQDQTRFKGSADRSFRSDRLRVLLAPKKLLRSVSRRFKMQESSLQFVGSSTDGCRGQSPWFVTGCRTRRGQGPNPSVQESRTSAHGRTQDHGP